MSFKKTIQDILENKGISFDKKNDTVKKMVDKLEEKISSKYKYYGLTIKKLKEECDKVGIKYKKNIKKIELINKLIERYDVGDNDYFKYNLHNLKINTFYGENIHLKYRYPFYFAIFKKILNDMPKRIDGIAFIIFSYTLHRIERYFIGKKLLSVAKPSKKLYTKVKSCKKSKEELLLLCKEIGISKYRLKTNIRGIRHRLYIYSFGDAAATYSRFLDTKSFEFRLLERYNYYMSPYGLSYDHTIGSPTDSVLSQFLNTL